MGRPVIQRLRPPPGGLRISVKAKVRNGREDMGYVPHSRAFSRLTQCSPGSHSIATPLQDPWCQARSQTSNTHHFHPSTGSANHVSRPRTYLIPLSFSKGLSTPGVWWSLAILRAFCGISLSYPSFWNEFLCETPSCKRICSRVVKRTHRI
jgi:hypothetical protein